MNEQLKKALWVSLCVVLSLFLLGWLLKNTDFVHTWEVIKSSDGRYLAAAGLLCFGINFLIWWRWRILMKGVGLKSGKLNSLRWFFLGLFCNLSPTSVGGDVVKGLGLAQETGHRPKIFASIVLDRLSGLFGIVITAAIALTLGHGIVQNKAVIVAVAFMSMVLVLFGAVLFSHRIFSFACRVFSVFPKVREALMRMHEDILLLRGKQRYAWEAIGVSVAAQALLAIVIYLTAKGMHQDISVVYFIVFSPIVCVISFLPSIGGFGVREMGWVGLLSTIGVHKSVALGLSLINGAFMLSTGILGGLFYVATLSLRRVQHHPSGPGVGARVA